MTKTMIAYKYCLFLPINLSRSIRYALYSQKKTVHRKEYVQQLIKKFVFQIHPDYFFNHKKFQLINETNLKILNDISDHYNEENDDYYYDQFSTVQNSQRTKITRTLNFYIKPSESLPNPRKVKLSIHRLESSLVEILETIGIDLPTRPANYEYNNNSKNNYKFGKVTSKEIIDFFETINDRKDLMQWRSDRINWLKKLEKMLIDKTGIDGIEFRNSYSAQNNAILISSLIEAIESVVEQEELGFPWNGIKLIISKDNTYLNPINYDENYILFDPSQTPLQWIKIISSTIKSEDIIKMKEIKEQNKKYILKFENLLNNKIVNYLKIKYEKNINNKIKVKLSKGFTCREFSFRLFLMNNCDNNIISDNDIIDINNNNNNNNNNEDMIIKPTIINFIIEESYGNKLLDDGSIRIDYINNNIDNLLFSNDLILKSIEISNKHIELKNDINKLRKFIINRLGLIDIKSSTGINDVMMKSFLDHINNYLNTLNNDNKGILKNLNNLNIIVGRYIGLSDDGSCIIPWDIELR